MSNTKRRRKKTTAAKSERFAMRIDPTIRGELLTLAKGADRSLSNYVAQILKQHVSAVRGSVPVSAQPTALAA